jgi:hypothetical protein
MRVNWMLPTGPVYRGRRGSIPLTIDRPGARDQARSARFYDHHSAMTIRDWWSCESLVIPSVR